MVEPALCAREHYSLQLLVRAPWYKKPLVAVFEALFKAGAAMDVGLTTLLVKDHQGRVIKRFEFGRDRTAAHRFRRSMEIDLDTLGPAEFRDKYGLRG